jgi:hypothetical protein
LRLGVMAGRVAGVRGKCVVAASHNDWGLRR